MLDFDVHDGKPLALPKGCHGRIAHIDLTTFTVNYEKPDAIWWRRYLGGGALGGYYLLRDVPIGTDALAPENSLIFASSVVAGLDAPGVSKHTVVAKSPLTGAAGESQSVGTFGAGLKKSGLDAIVVTGKAASPVYLRIHQGKVEILAAQHVWGRDVADAHDALIAAEDGPAHSAIIGVAGENLVRYASIVNDVRFMNCRNGMGAVMGSKQLKALVVVPDEEPEVAYPQLLADVRRDWEENNQVTVHNKAQSTFGISSWLSATEGGEDWTYVVGNYDDSVFPELSELSASVLEEKYAQPQPETYKWFDYARIYHVIDGPYKTDSRYGGCEGNSLAAVGPPLRISNPEQAFKLNELTYRYGLDPESLGMTLAWVMSGHKKGYLPQDFAPDLNFGAADAAIEMVRAIAKREGQGDLLAEGSARVAPQFGAEAVAQTMTCKAKEIPVHEARNKPALALAYGVGPVGPDYCSVEHDWDYSPDGFPYILKKSHAYGVLKGTEESVHDIEKVPQAVLLQRWWSGALETLLFDLFAAAPARYLAPTHIEQLCRAATGWDLTVYEIMAVGERRIVQFQEFNRRHGLSRNDDYLPDRMYDEPLPDGLYVGAHVDRDWYEKALDLYYEMSGFDGDGWPREGKLREISLSTVYESRPTNAGL